MSEDEVERLIEALIDCGTDWATVMRAVRAYGDERERAGLERAADIVSELMRQDECEWSEYDWLEDALNRILAQVVRPAPNAGGAKVESEVEGDA